MLAINSSQDGRTVLSDEEEKSINQKYENVEKFSKQMISWRSCKLFNFEYNIFVEIQFQY